MNRHFRIVLSLIVLFFPLFSQAEEVGREAARKYIGQKPKGEARPESSGSASGDRFLAVHVGHFFSDRAYHWGPDAESDVGSYQLGFTYRIGDWMWSTDLSVRVDWMNYKPDGQRVNKLAFLPAIFLPDAKSGFPLYFGVAAGPSVFLKQLPGESAIAFDYQLLIGLRFFNLYENSGVFIESGLKNSLLVLSDGQHSDGSFVSLGAVFQF